MRPRYKRMVWSHLYSLKDWFRFGISTTKASDRNSVLRIWPHVQAEDVVSRSSHAITNDYCKSPHSIPEESKVEIEDQVIRTLPRLSYVTFTNLLFTSGTTFLGSSC